MRYEKIEPFGSQRDNWHMAVLASILSRVHTPKGKRAPTVEDFMFVDPETRKEQNVEAADLFFDRMGS